MKVFIAMMIVLVTLYAQEGTKKVVYDLTTDSTEKFSKNILSGIVFQKNHFESKLEDLQVMVVIHGQAYRFFLKSTENTKFASDQALVQKHADLLKRIESLHKNYGVKFMACESGLKNHNLVPDQLIPLVQLIPTSTTGLINAQNDGYAYIPTY